MVKSSVSIPNGPVIIKTKTGTFDCIGLVLGTGSYKDNDGRTLADYYTVKVYKYMDGDYSSKDQKYYFHEVKKFYPCGEDYKVAELLYAEE